MQSLMRTAGRGLSVGLAGVLVAGTTALVAPAQAVSDVAPEAPHLDWRISTTFVEHLFTGEMYPGAVATNPLPGVVSDGAKYTDGGLFGGADDTFTFPQASKKVVDGDVVRSYRGTVEGTFVNGSTRYYSVTVSDPVVTVTKEGAGSITATVSSEVYDNPGQVAAVTAPRQVVMADIASVSVEGTRTAVTPAWGGVIPAGSPVATELGIPAGQPIDGKAFSPELIKNLVSTTRAHFYQSSTSASQAKKTPAVATLVTTPSVSSEVTIANRAEGLGITVKGHDFSAVTKPGDAGVYVALAPVDTVVNYSDRSTTAAMAAVDYVVPQRFQGSEFTAVLNVPTEKLEIGKKYAIFTWQAHLHSNSSQDTKTPVEIDWTKWNPTATSTTLSAKGGTLAATLTAKVSPAAAGKVTFKEGTKTLGTANVVNGVATLKVSGLTGGTKSVSAVFAPAKADEFKASTAKTVRVAVAKAASKTTLKVTKKATRKKTGKVSVSIAGGKVKATGKVKVVVKAPGKKAVTKRVTLKKGKAAVALTKAKKKGTYAVTVTYAGDAKLKAPKKKVVKFKVK